MGFWKKLLWGEGAGKSVEKSQQLDQAPVARPERFDARALREVDAAQRLSAGTTKHARPELNKPVLGEVRGTHYSAQADVIRALKRKGLYAEALRLILECVEAAEQEARSTGMEPAPGFTKMAAIEYRRLKEYDAELAILERWQLACPPGRGSHKIEERLVKVRELLSKNK